MIKKVAAELVEHYAFHGVILVGKKDNVLFQRAYGLAQREWLVPHIKDSIFNVCSITKIITAVAILQNLERGTLRLDTSLSEFLPDYPYGTSITIHHLLSHSSGLPEICATSAFMHDKNNPTTPFESIIPILKEPLNFEPGTRHAYSNTNYLILTGILEKITGVTYQEYLKENIFNPLGMDNTSYLDTKKIILHRARGYCHQEPYGLINAPYFDDSWPQGAGGLSSTAYDLFLLSKALSHNTLITKATTQLMLTPYQSIDGHESLGYGYGCELGNYFGQSYMRHRGEL